jgi:hypothetical protein
VKFFLFAILLLVFGCSTYSKQECLEMDQFQFAYGYGTDGVSSVDPAVARFQDTCFKDHGINADKDKMGKGFESGKNFYCSEEGIRLAATKGKTYTGICNKVEEAKILPVYNQARTSFLENKVQELEREIDRLKSSLSTCESNVSSLHSQLMSAQAHTTTCP